MSIRYATCGSKNVYVETKKEGYNLKAGVIGTALVGVPGALAGTVGNDTKYYHCRECGQTLNKPMMSIESDWIDKWIANPIDYQDELKSMKSKYKNIEWEISDYKIEEVLRNTKRKISIRPEFSNLTPINRIAESIYVELQQMNITLISEEQLRLMLNDEDASGYISAISRLEDSGRIAREKIGTNTWIRLITDISEMKELALKEDSKSEANHLLNKNLKKYQKNFMQKVEFKKKYSLNELYELVENNLCNIIPNQTTYFWEVFRKDFLESLQKKEQLYFKDGDYYFRTLERAEEILSAKEREQEEKQKKKYLVLMQILLDIFKNYPEEMFTIEQIMKERLVVDSSASIRSVKYALGYLREDGMIIKKKSYYALTGIEERLEEKRRCEEEEFKRHKEEIDKKNEEIRKENELIENENTEIRIKIDELEKERNLVNITISDNKNKLFGAGAKARKEAQARAEEINKEIIDLRNQIKFTKKYLSL